MLSSSCEKRLNKLLINIERKVFLKMSFENVWWLLEPLFIFPGFNNLKLLWPLCDVQCVDVRIKLPHHEVVLPLTILLYGFVSSYSVVVTALWVQFWLSHLLVGWTWMWSLPLCALVSPLVYMWEHEDRTNTYWDLRNVLVKLLVYSIIIFFSWGNQVILLVFYI